VTVATVSSVHICERQYILPCIMLVFASHPRLHPLELIANHQWPRACAFAVDVVNVGMASVAQPTVSLAHVLRGVDSVGKGTFCPAVAVGVPP